MLELLRNFADTANESDMATAQIAYNMHTTSGIPGARSRKSLDSFYEKCESLQLALRPDVRDSETRLRVMIESALLRANLQFYDLFVVAKTADKTGSWSSLAGTLELVRRMLDEDEKKSALLAATEGASGGTGVALPTVSSTQTATSKGDPRKR